MEQLMVAELREICARYSTDDLTVTVFQPYFIYIDQYLAIKPQTLQTIFVTAAVMVLISLLLIPNFACALWVSFSIGKIMREIPISHRIYPIQSNFPFQCPSKLGW